MKAITRLVASKETAGSANSDLLHAISKCLGGRKLIKINTPNYAALIICTKVEPNNLKDFLVEIKALGWQIDSRVAYKTTAKYYSINANLNEVAETKGADKGTYTQLTILNEVFSIFLG